MENLSAKIDIQIPDFWYDIYARFLPGVTFVGSLWWSYSINTAESNFKYLFIIVFVGYLVGIVVNPISSVITELLQKFLEHILKDIKPGFVDWIRHSKDVSDHEKQIIGKMRAEVVFFAQMTLLSSLLLFFPTQFHDLLIPLIIIFAAFTGIVSIRRIMRAEIIHKNITNGSNVTEPPIKKKKHSQKDKSTI